MIIVEPQPHYIRDYKKLKKDHYKVGELDIIAEKMLNGQSLNEYHDHALTGDMQGLRELHVDKKKQSNWLLLYEVIEGTYYLYRTGSHDYITGK